MPLQPTDTPYYIKRQRLYIDSAAKIPDESRSNFDYTVYIKGDVKNIISIELVDWNLKNVYSPTFIGRYNSILPGNYYPGPVTDAIQVNNRQQYAAASTFDIRIENETQTAELILSVDMAEYLFPQSLAGIEFTTRQTVVDAVTAAIQFHFEKLGTTNTIINYTNTSFTVQLDVSGHFQIYFFRTVGNAAMPSYFLFGSGPTKTESAPKPLGFIPDLDTVLPALSDTGVVGMQYVLTSTNLVNTMPFRYVDISVAEVNFTPLSRVFFQSEPAAVPLYNQPFDKGTDSRLLTEPIKKMEKINIKLTLEGGREPSFYGDSTHQLTFEILEMVPKQQSSNWIVQKFKF